MIEILVYSGDGTYKRAMETVRALNPIPKSRALRQRSAPKRSKGRTQRHPLGASHRRTMEGLAATLSPASDLPPLVPDLVQAGDI